MKKINLYQIDTFTTTIFSGNPAGVCPLNEWLCENEMQSIALENNLSETAFYVNKGDYFEIRWFTPTTEVDLCGHATLASAFVEFNINKNTNKTIVFKSKTDSLSVTQNKGLLTLDFPVDTLTQIDLTNELTEPFNFKPIKAYRGNTDIMLVFSSEEEIRGLKPSLAKVAKIKARGIIATAKGINIDFVSRFFGPQSGIDEDPVTGSAHTTLIPYWSNHFDKKVMRAKQLSKRGGELLCEINKERVKISGHATLYMQGKILLPAMP